MTNTSARCLLPEIIERKSDREGAKHILRLNVPASLAWFAGHFPADPILPAVVQIDWVIHFGAQLGIDRERFSGMDRLKFRAVITPGMEVLLHLEAMGESLRFSYESADGIHSKGVILFRSNHHMTQQND